MVLPDTQYYSSSNAAIFMAQTQWIADNRDAQQIAFVSIDRRRARLMRPRGAGRHFVGRAARGTAGTGCLVSYSQEYAKYDASTRLV